MNAGILSKNLLILSEGSPLVPKFDTLELCSGWFETNAYRGYWALGKEGEQETRLRGVVKVTQRFLEKEMKEYTEALETYQSSLWLKCQGVAQKVENIDRAQRFLCQWHGSIFPVIQGRIWPNLAAFCERIEEYSGKDNSAFWLKYHVTMLSGEKLFRILEWEKRINTHLPHAILFQLASDKGEISKKKICLIQDFLKRWPKEKGFALHDVLQEVHSLWKSRSPQGLQPLAEFECRLFKLDCPILLQPDGRYLRWAQKVMKTMRVGEYELESCLLETEHQSIFSIKDVSKKVLVIGKNGAMLGMQEAAHRASLEIADSPKRARLLEYHGDFLIREHLPHNLAAYSWESTVDDWTKEEKKLFRLITRMVETMISERYTPHLLDARELYFSLGKTPMLRSLITMTRDQFRYVLIEKCLFDMEHEGAFRLIMKNSGMQKEAQFTFFRAVVQGEIFPDSHETSTLTLRSDYKIMDPEAKIREIKLRQEVRDMLKLSWESLDPNLKAEGKMKFCKCFWDIYTQTAAAAYLHPQVGVRAIKKFKETQ